MHPLASDALVRAGYPDHRHVAHQFRTSELGRIDLVVALDRRHQQTLRGLGADPDRLVLLRAFDAASGRSGDVPDPYYGDDAVFDECRDMIAAALCRPRCLPRHPLGHALGRLTLPAPRPPPLSAFTPSAATRRRPSPDQGGHPVRRSADPGMRQQRVT